MARLATDLKIYGPRYAQLLIAVLDEPLVDAKFTVTWTAHDGEVWERSFSRGYVREGEEILLAPPIGADGDPSGMEIEELIESYRTVTVQVAGGGLAPCGIESLADYWNDLSAASVVEQEDHDALFRRYVENAARSIERALDGHRLAIENAMYATTRAQLRAADPPDPAVTSRWKFWKRKQRKRELVAHERLRPFREAMPATGRRAA